MNTLDQNNKIENKDSQPESSFSTNMLYLLKVTEYLFLATCLGFGIIYLVIPDDPKLAIIAAISLAIFVFLFLTNQQLFKNARQAKYKLELQKKAEIYVMDGQNDLTNNPIVTARGKALEYGQDLINDYKGTRQKSRILYYSLQLGTIIFSGVTPILVLLDKLETGQTWLKWLPVIFPAIASIVASIVTSFPFQENFISANKTVELLEAEQEKFVLGVTPLYRCDGSINDSQQQQRALQSIENFIIQVNNIHLKQLEKTSDTNNNDKETTQKAA